MNNHNPPPPSKWSYLTLNTLPNLPFILYVMSNYRKQQCLCKNVTFIRGFKEMSVPSLIVESTDSDTQTVWWILVLSLGHRNTLYVSSGEVWKVLWSCQVSVLCVELRSAAIESATCRIKISPSYHIKSSLFKIWCNSGSSACLRLFVVAKYCLSLYTYFTGSVEKPWKKKTRKDGRISLCTF